MKKITDIVKNNMLPLAILAGILGYRFFGQFAFLSPYFLFAMLTLSFSRVSIKELKPVKCNFVLLAVQLISGYGLYFLVLPFNEILAQSIMAIVLCPTATSAVVITTKLGGSAAGTVTYTLMINLAVAVTVPLVFPFLNSDADISFMEAFSKILIKVLPLLVCPMILTELLRYAFKRVHSLLVKHSNWSFNLWAVSLAILMGSTTQHILDSPQYFSIDIIMASGSLLMCIFLYTVGKKNRIAFQRQSYYGSESRSKKYNFCYLACTNLPQPFIVGRARILCYLAKSFQHMAIA